MSRTTSSPLVAWLLAVSVLSACSATAEPPTSSSTRAATGASSPPTSATPEASPGEASASPVVEPSAGAPKQLPRGGRTLLPTHRLVGFAGHPSAASLGRLGVGPLRTKGTEITRQGRPYATSGRTVLPVFEVIATVVHRGPGKDGMYRSRMDDKTIATYLAAARKAKGLLLLDIQPGRADFLPETKAYERWLKEPDVGVALDPEWAIEKGEIPGKSYGRTTGSELDVVASYLAGLVAKHNLPDKVMVFHQVAASIVRGIDRLHPHKGVVLIRSVDGIGSPGMKRDTWRQLVADSPRHVHTGFKLFYDEDKERGGRLMTPREVLALRPQPVYVIYE